MAEAADRHGKPVEALRAGRERPLRLSFSGRSLSVQGGCNTRFGGYALESGALRPGCCIQKMDGIDSNI
ncbi:META domain-containing protein [Castellaniella defragrans]|nr:META domain-containing protein [Castellaniella defragrans]